jgi:MFS family permease
VLIGLWFGIMSLGGGLSFAAVQSAAIESAPRRYSGMASGVFTTSANLGGIIGITWTAVYLGSEPDISPFPVIFAAYLVAAVFAVLISSRIRPWPAHEDDPAEPR